MTLTLFNLIDHVNEQRHHSTYHTQYGKFTLSHERMTYSASLYANQLLRVGDWRQALLVTHYIPVTFKKQRKQVVFSILQQKAMLTLKELDKEEVKLNHEYILLHLQIPKEMFYIARAIQYQALGQYEKAIGDWMQAQNHNMAHSIFISQIAPLYFKPVEACK